MNEVDVETIDLGDEVRQALRRVSTLRQSYSVAQ
jgi:hypothetical protein